LEKPEKARSGGLTPNSTVNIGRERDTAWYGTRSKVQTTVAASSRLPRMMWSREKPAQFMRRAARVHTTAPTARVTVFLPRLKPALPPRAAAPCSSSSG